MPSHIAVRRPTGLLSVNVGGAVVQPVRAVPSYPYFTVGVEPSLKLFWVRRLMASYV